MLARGRATDDSGSVEMRLKRDDRKQDDLRAELDELRHEVGRLRAVEADLEKATVLRRVLAEIATAVSESDSLEGLIRQIHGLLGELIDTRNFFVALYDDLSRTYSIPFYRDQCDQLESFEKVGALEGSLTDHVRRTGKPLFLTRELEKQLQEEGAISGIKGTPAKGWLGAPLHSPGSGVIGSVVVQSYDDADLYTEADLELMELVAGQIAVAVERKRFEQALARSNSFLQTVIEQAPFGIQICEGDQEHLRLTAINREAKRIFGISDSQLNDLVDDGVSGRDAQPWHMLHPDGKDWPISETPLTVAMALGTVTPRAEMVIRRADETELTVLVSAAPIRDADHNLIGGVATYSDISDRKKSEEDRLRLERQVLHSQKLESLGVLAGGIAHDFNNLLMVILANTDIMLLDAVPASPNYDAITEIEDAAQRASDLVRQLGAYSGKKRFSTEAMDLNEVITVRQHMLEMAVSKFATLHYELAESLPVIEADTSQVQQVVMGLVSNASEAIGDQEGTITVRTGVQVCDRFVLSTFLHGEERDRGPYAFFEVSDNGCGMDEETLGRIFDPFFTTKFVGRGLGMAAVQGIIQAHNGAIRVESKVGKGSTFRVIFPVIDPGATGAVIENDQD